MNCCMSGVFKAFGLTFLVVALLAFGFGCAEDSGEDFGIGGFCKNFLNCCEDVGEDYCVYEGEEDQLQDICEINVNAAIDAMENNAPKICDKWYGLQATFMRCLGDKKADCDEWLGEDRSKDSAPGELDNYMDICDKQCEDLVDFNKDFDVSKCGSLVSFGGKDNEACLFTWPI